MSVRERLAGALSRVLGDEAARPRTSLDDALLFESHERASKTAETAVRISQAAGATAAQQKSALDAAADQARMLVARGRDTRAPTQQIRDALERAKLVALNTGLEGARMGEAAGKPLVMVSEEMRGLVVRALESLDEHLGLLAQVEREREKLLERIEQARDRARDLADEMLRAQAAERETEQALGELGRSLSKTSTTDPETARALTEAAEHARGLLGALTALSARGDRGTVLNALAPALRPLFRALRELYRGRRGEPES